MVSKVIAFAAGLVSLSSAIPTPLAPRDDVYWPVTEFSAGKPHLSSYVNYNFKIAAPAPDSPVLTCSASQDAGSSGATYLPYVWAGTCRGADGQVVPEVQWRFSQAPPEGTVSKDATFTVTWREPAPSITVYTGTYTIPGSQVWVDLNQEPNPFDNDVNYVGPKEFRFTNITVAV